ncbi:MAG: alpha/beta hydrolase [Deltaproteobacteria bacterium]|nr:alpha/beta hydrolase [Deltaproteobacteria bacterium]
MTTPRVTPDGWRRRGRVVETAAGKIFVVVLEPPRATPERAPLLVLHGFPTSSWDFAEAAGILSRTRKVVLFDFLGFGYSEKPEGAAYSLFEQAEVTLLVARALELSRAHVWAHDMGTSVLTELLARREHGLCPLAFASVTFMNGSMHMDLATPTIGQHILKSRFGPAFARLSSRATFTRQLARVFAKAPPREMLDAMWELASRDDGLARFPAVVKYMDDRVRFARRWLGALARADLPVLVAWGELDPVARLAIAERLARETPGARLETFPGLGHYPQVEDPSSVAAVLERFLEATDRASA